MGFGPACALAGSGSTTAPALPNTEEASSDPPLNRMFLRVTSCVDGEIFSPSVDLLFMTVLL